jgi:hypothetical protein
VRKKPAFGTRLRVPGGTSEPVAPGLSDVGGGDSPLGFESVLSPGVAVGGVALVAGAGVAAAAVAGGVDFAAEAAAGAPSGVPAGVAASAACGVTTGVAAGVAGGLAGGVVGGMFDLAAGTAAGATVVVAAGVAAPCAIVSASTFEVDPDKFVAVSVTVKFPGTVGIPETKPVIAFTASPGGSPVAP